MKLLDKEVLYEDNHLLVLDKPSLLLTQPTDLNEDSLMTRAKEYIKKKYQKKGEVFLHPVHRLDRVAKGVVVFARTSKALSRLNEQIRSQGWKKTYLLRHEGELPENEGTITSFLFRKEYRTEIVGENTEGSKKATLHYKKIGDHLASVDLETGRYHQIRAQFASIGCPICGDQKYGAKSMGMGEGIALLHAQVSFIHPVKNELIVIKTKQKIL